MSDTIPVSSEPGTPQDVFEREQGKIYAYFRRAGLQDADAEDRVQTVRIEVWKDGARCRGRARAWVWSVVRHRLVDHRRTSRRNPLAGAGELPADLVTVTASEVGGQGGEACEVLSQYLSRLTPRQGEVVLLLLRGLKVAEIAAQLGVTPAAVHQLRLRALAAVRLGVPAARTRRA